MVSSTYPCSTACSTLSVCLLSPQGVQCDPWNQGPQCVHSTGLLQPVDCCIQLDMHRYWVLHTLSVGAAIHIYTHHIMCHCQSANWFQYRLASPVCQPPRPLHHQYCTIMEGAICEICEEHVKLGNDTTIQQLLLYIIQYWYSNSLYKCVPHATTWPWQEKVELQFAWLHPISQLPRFG